MEKLLQNADSKENNMIIEKGILKKYEGWDSEVIVPEGVTGIGAEAFQFSYQLETIILPESLRVIDERAFESCSALKKAVLPEGLERIGGWAFAYCCHLQTISIPSTLKKIGEGAFWECKQLEQLAIPASCLLGSDIAKNHVFYGCKRLASIEIRPSKETNVEDGVKKLIAIDHVLYTEDMSQLIFCPPAWKKDTIRIPEGVKTIGTYAFRGCRKLIRIQLPETLEEIAYGAFQECSHLRSIDIPAGCKKIFPCFAGCRQLTRISAAEGNENYFSHDGILMSRVDSCTRDFHTEKAFETLENDCILYAYPASKKGAEYRIPDFVTMIGEQAFHSNRTLQHISIPETIHTILNGAFEKCTLLQDMIIPETVKRLPYRGFSGCKRLKTVTILSPSTELPMEIFEQCYQLTSVTLPDTIKTIEYGAFAECSALEAIHLPTELREIDACAFDSCSNLRSIEIPSKVTEIRSFTFEHCRNLTEVVIPDSVNKICEYAFTSQDSLRTVVIRSEDIVIDKKAFPAGMYAWDDDNYDENDEEALLEPYFSENERYKNMHFYGRKNSGTEEYARKYGVTFHELHHQDEGGAFYIERARYYNFPEFEEKEGNFLIRYFGQEETVVIPGSAEIIAEHAFENRDSIRKMAVSEGVEKIDSSALKECRGLEEVILPESLKEIAFSALEGCANLKEVIFPNAPLKVQPRAFADCSSLKRAVVPETVMLVPNDAVWNWDMDEDRPLERALNYDIFENCPEVVICGVPGSGAEEYARMAKLPFEAIG